jgi:hypothetical protein
MIRPDPPRKPAHNLEIQTSLGETRSFRLVPRTVAAFYDEFMDALHSLGIHVKVCYPARSLHAR